MITSWCFIYSSFHLFDTYQPQLIDNRTNTSITGLHCASALPYRRSRSHLDSMRNPRITAFGHQSIGASTAASVSWSLTKLNSDSLVKRNAPIQSDPDGSTPILPSGLALHSQPWKSNFILGKSDSGAKEPRRALAERLYGYSEGLPWAIAGDNWIAGGFCQAYLRLRLTLDN